MSDFKRELSGAEPDDATLERVWTGVRDAPRAGPRRLRWVLTGAAALAVLGAGLWATRPVPVEPAPREPVQAPPHPASLQLAERATVESEPGAALTTPGPHAVTLERGAARFALDDGPWEVSSRHLKLVVASAMFRLEVGDAQDSVSVSRGEVQLSGPGLTPFTLRAGQSFSTGASGWEVLARTGDLEAAWRRLGAAGVRAAAPAASPEVRLLLSDVATAGRDEGLSRELLREVMRGPAGPERGLAAFTLGKRAQAAGQTREAIEALRQSLTLDLPAELQDDARERLRALERP